MPLALGIIPQLVEVVTPSCIVKPTGKDGRFGPSLEGGSTSPDLGARSPKRASGAALGTYGKIASVGSAALPPSDPAATLARRFILQGAARRLMPLEGVAGCLRRRQGGKEFVDIWHLPEVMRAKYGGLQTCSSVWLCPVCAAKITERRRLEVRAAIDAWRASGGDVVLATFTVRHSASDALRPLAKGMLSSLRRLSSGDAGGLLKSRYGLVGSIRSVEVTYGEDNGWHPHVHSLLFVEKGCKFELLWLHLRKQWDNALRLEGMKDVTARGVDLRWANEQIAGYVTKMGCWDIEHELAKGPVKLGRSGNVSPLQMLAGFADWVQNGGGDVSAPGYKFGGLWQTYAVAMKGVHQLQFSRGLRALLGLGKAKSDADLADEKDALGVLLARLGKKEWALVLHFEQRAELLTVAGAGDAAAVSFFITELDWRFVDAQEERRFRVSTQDSRTEWEDQREAEAEDLGLTRSEYLRWRRGGVEAMANSVPSAVVAVPDPGVGEVVKGNSATLAVLGRRLVVRGRVKVAALPLLTSADAVVEEGSFEAVEEYGRNGYSERFNGL